MSEQQLMKSGLGTNAVDRICAVLTDIIADFPVEKFREEALGELEQLELKQRVDYLIAVLANYLPEDFEETAEILLQVKQYWDWGDTDDALSSFAAWPLIDYVAAYGLNHPQQSLMVLKKLTSLFSAEFAIRPFIEQHFTLTYQMLLHWCDDDNEHVRRLACEGIRPRLPWGKRLTRLCDNPDAIFAIVEKLKDDSSLYVRKSVANNLNDISKDNPDKVIALCQQWNQDSSVKRDWIIKQALRSLVKQGREEVFPLLGYTVQPRLTVETFELNKQTIHIGSSLQIGILIHSTINQEQNVVIDYKIHHVKANGSMNAKVFKWKNSSLQAGQDLALTKIHSFKLLSTRKYYPGEHKVELLINGKPYAEQLFQLVF